ncbi:MAG: tyrosine-protein phosphatase [Lachnospiraceae bacterium]|nr:tyrosine-protein phosphatase [Lachnospiraceae bacterium]
MKIRKDEIIEFFENIARMAVAALLCVSILLVGSSLVGCTNRDAGQSATIVNRRPVKTNNPVAKKAGQEESGAIALKDYPIEHELEFGGAYIKATIDEFSKLGFKFGDSVNIEFSNGYKLEDIPYYNGYYVPNGTKFIIGYPTYDYIKFAVNNGDDPWDEIGLTDDTTATITLNESEKYLDIQEARDLSYSDDRNDYSSDVMFANFRCMRMANLKPNLLYRSASPANDERKRVAYVTKFAKKYNIRYIIDLADTEAKIDLYKERGYEFSYFLNKLEKNKVSLVGLNMNYGSDEFREKVAGGLKDMTKNNGPYLIHCNEGKDRTGYFCMVLEALAGANYEQIKNDYMITYKNYYRITKAKDEKKYNTIITNLFDPMLQSIVGDESVDIKTADLGAYTEKMLLKAGMTQKEINTLKKKITK